jgi:hypothetical protein
LSIEYDRLMALMLRKDIYLFDVCLLSRLHELFIFAKSGRAPPKNAWLARRITPAQIYSEIPTAISSF